MRIIITIFIAILLSGCNGCNDTTVVTPPIITDTVVIPPIIIDTIITPPLDTTVIVVPPTDTVIVTPPVVILVPFEVSADIENETTQDLKDVLKDYKDGRNINIEKVALGNRTGQAFYISANNSKVEIKYTTKQSLENAVYTYLDMLGIHWYGAGENWLHNPTVLNKVNIAGEWKEPTFRNRIFAGTGGLETPLPTIDANYNYKNNWNAWKRRIRMNADFYDIGHSGAAFYYENKDILDANPNWFNSAQGRYSGRIKIDSAAAVQVYKTWAKKQYNPANNFTTIGTDPEDGRGGNDDPLPHDGFDGIPKWNNSDKTWWLTNEVAKMFDENNSKIQVTAYAYGDGSTVALVPKFRLRKNVYPIIIPYAFQTSYLPDQMVKIWARNIEGKMGLYDYWNITQWSLGLPQFNIYTIPFRLKLWKENKVDGVNIETTDASGPMGHVWWLAGQLEWDLTKNIDTLFNKYLADCFGAAKAPIKKMYKRWSLNYQGKAEVNLSLKDLNDATQLVNENSIEWKRINDVKAYVHFMKMMAHRTSQTDNNNIYQYIYSIHQRMLVQTTAFTGQGYLGYPVPEPISTHQLTEQEVENNFIADLADLPVQYSISDFVFDFDKVSYTEPMSNGSWNSSRGAVGVFKAPFTGVVSINAGPAINATKLKVFSSDSLYLDESIDADSGYTYIDTLANGNLRYMKTFNFNIVEGQKYLISTKGGLGRLTFNTPGIVLFQNTEPDDFDNFAYPLKYFYVPIGTKEIAYFDNQTDNDGGSIRPPTGELLTRMRTNIIGTYKVVVPTGQDGKLWVAAFGHTQWGLLSIPNQTSLQKFLYTE